MSAPFKISIAMTTYNGAKFLPEQLQSIAGQTRSPDELIICDDGSTDQTISLIEDFAKQTTIPVRLSMNEARLGSTLNVSQAIACCSGDLVALSDQDDVWHPDKLKLTEATFRSNVEVGLLFTDAELVDEASQTIGESLWKTIGFDARKQQLVANGRAVDVLLSRNIVTGATMTFRSKFTKDILPIPSHGPLIHDGWIALIVALLGRIAFIAQPLIKYRQHADQQVGVRADDSITSVQRARRTNGSDYLAQAAQFELALQRISNGEIETSDRNRSLLLAKIAHLKSRAQLPRERLRRLPLITRETANRNYARFSRGWLSAARDLIV